MTTASGAPPVVSWHAGTDSHASTWLSPSSPPPRRVGTAGDETRAAAALARMRRGEALVYQGDYHGARQLLSAIGRRLEPRSPPRGSPADLFRAEREQTRVAHEVLSRLLVPVRAGWHIELRRAPDLRGACEEALGPFEGQDGLLPLRDLLGIIGAHEWRRRGLALAALGGERLHPHYGVYAPVRSEYVELVARAIGAWPVAGKRAVDVGTGTGVLAVLLARAGARVVATELEPRALACARENVARLAPAGAVEVVGADLFAANEQADLVVSNPPWVPAEAWTPLDRAVYDPGGAFLARLVGALPDHLAPGGEAWIVLSDLAERLGLRSADHLAALAADAGLRVDGVLEAPAAHPRARDRDDPLHAVRAREVVRLTRLVRR